jgi:hypothetical protein
VITFIDAISLAASPKAISDPDGETAHTAGTFCPAQICRMVGFGFAANAEMAANATPPCETAAWNIRVCVKSGCQRFLMFWFIRV